MKAHFIVDTGERKFIKEHGKKVETAQIQWVDVTPEEYEASQKLKTHKTRFKSEEEFRDYINGRREL